MQTVTINILNEKALKLLKDLEALNLIQVIRKSSSKGSSGIASRLKGSISGEQADIMEKELKEMRDEWHRDI